MLLKACWLYRQFPIHNYSRIFAASNPKELSKCVWAIRSSSHWDPVFSGRERKIRFWPGTVSLCYDNWFTVKWAFLVIFFKSFRKFSKTTASEYLFGIFKRSLETFYSLCSRSILYTGNTRSGINTWIDISITLDNSDIYF